VGVWQKTTIGEFLFEREGKFKPDDEVLSGLSRINKIDFSGKFHILQKPSNTKMILIKQGDLVISGINVAKGAMGIYNGKEDITATIHYSYTFDTKKINVEYFRRFLKSSEFIRLLQEQVKGGIKTEIKPKHILSLEIDLPDLTEQEKLLARFKSIETEDEELKQEITHQQSLLIKLRQQILQEAIEGKLTQDWRAENSPPLTRGGAEGGGVRDEGVKKLNNLPHLKTFRKSLRKNLTPAEAKLWTLLKGKQLKGRKFRRQHSVANYILDFYCPSEKLAIELDGEVHNNPQAAEYDRERDIFLAHTGIKVLRFENKVVFENPDGLLGCVEREFNSSSSLNPSAPVGHLPLSGEELFSSPPDKGEYRKAGREYEPASELLSRIQAEKQQLINDKKIKKQKPLPAISEEEKPFELPDGWVWCRFGDVLESTFYGPRFGKGEYVKSGIPTIRTTDMTDGIISFKNPPMVNVNNPQKVELYKLNYDDLLVTRTGSIGTMALYKSTELAFPSAYLIRCRFLNIEMAEFLFNYLLTPMIQEHFGLNTKTGTRPNINAVSISSSILPLPPLEEQKAIVAKVEKLLTLCNQLETQITSNQSHAEQLMQAVLKEAFSQGDAIT
jgi:very-short-patch-repair endonuclease